MKHSKFEDETDLSLLQDSPISKEEVFVSNKKEKAKQEEENFITYILQNYETINSLTSNIEWMQFFAIICFLLFILALNIRAFVDFNVFVITGFLVFSWGFFVLQINFIIKIKIILDEFETETSSNNSSGSTIQNLDKNMMMNNNSNNYINNNKFSSNNDNIHITNISNVNNNNVNYNNNIIISSSNNNNNALNQGNNNNNHRNSNIINSSVISNNEKTQSSHFGSIMMIICFNLIALNMLIFIILMSIKFNDWQIIKFHFINIPFIISLVIASLFFIYILPVLIEKKLIKELILGVLSLICLFAFNFLIEENDLNKRIWMVTAIPLIILSSLFLIYIVLNYNSYNQILFYIFHVIGMVIVTTIIILLFFFFSNKIPIHYAYLTIPSFFGFLLIFSMKLYYFFNPKDMMNHNSNEKSAKKSIS